LWQTLVEGFSKTTLITPLATHKREYLTKQKVGHLFSH